MANNNRNQGDQFYDSNQDWDQNRRRSNFDDDYNRNRENYGNMNYNRDYDDRNRGSYRNSGTSESGGNYGGQRDYGDMRNVEYGDVYHGNVERRERETNQAQGGRENIYNQSNRERWGSNQGYSGGSNKGREDYDRDWNNRGGDYGSSYGIRRDYGSSYGQGNYGDQGRRNYGNMSGRRDDRDWWDRTKDEVSSWFGGSDANRRTGEHKGKGPRGYKRSDERIREDIHDRLYEDPYVDASDIEVNVNNGEVVLSGSVTEKEQKRRAEDVAEAVSGVHNVENRIRVNKEASRANYGTATTANDYTGTSNDTGNIGVQSGTTNEIIRNTGNMNESRK